MSFERDRSVWKKTWIFLSLSFFAIIFACFFPKGVSLESFQPVKTPFLL